MANPPDIMEIDNDEPVAITTTAPITTASGSQDVVDAAPLPTATAPVPAPPVTPRKLYDIPEVPERYAPIVSTLEDVVYRDACKFSLKPPCWEKWTAPEYRTLGDYLTLFDLRPLARELGKSVEEVYHMYHGVVTKPLYDASAAHNKGLQGMKKWFAFYNKLGTQNRLWAEDESKRGELDNITHRTVHIILQKSGYKCEIKLEDLKDDDFKYIQDTVDIRHRKILSGHAVGDPWRPKSEDGLPQSTLKRKANSPEPEPATPAKQARLAENGNATAPAKMRTTPSAFAATPQASRVGMNPVETPTRPHESMQPSTAAEAPTPSKPPTVRTARQTMPSRQPSGTVETPSKAPKVAISSTPKATKKVILPVSPPEPFAFRSWTANRVFARFRGTVPGCVVLLERKTLRRITVPLSALDQDDKEWFNKWVKENEIDRSHVRALKGGGAPVHVFRYWTDRAEVVIGRCVFVSRLKVHVELEEQVEERMVSIPFEDLSEMDRAWIRENISHYDKRTLSDFEAKKAAQEAKAAEMAQSAPSATSNSSIETGSELVVIDSASDQDADHESEASDVVRTQKRARGPAKNQSIELADRSMSVAPANQDSTMGSEDDLSTGSAQPAGLDSRMGGVNEEEIEVARASTPTQDLAVRAASRAPEAFTANDSFETTQESQSEAGDNSVSPQDGAVRALSKIPATFPSIDSPEPEYETVEGSVTEEPFETITGAPIRQWTDFNVVGNLVGIAEYKVFLRVEGRDELVRLPLAQWSEADRQWFREYLVKDQREIRSGKAKLGDRA